MLLLVAFLKKLTFPKSRNEDTARREFILNVLLLSATVLLSVGTLVNIANILSSDPTSHQANSLSTLVLCGLLLFFLVLYSLSRRQHIVLASYLLLGTFFLLTAYIGYIWGVDVPAQIVFYPLVIVMTSILISTRVAFLATVLIGITMTVTGYLEDTGFIQVSTYWKTIPWTWSDITMIILIYLIVATVSWLSNREIEKSLERARRSEAELKQERDTLEVRVEERTHELRQAEMEKMSQAYRFVEFGRISSGIFHDLMNPLAALSLNIDHIAEVPGIRTALSGDVARAKSAAAHMQKLMESMRKHLAREGNQELFPLKQSLKDVAHMLASYAKARDVRILVRATEPAHLYGDPVAFAQVMTNLVSNAVQAYPPADISSNKAAAREVAISLERVEDGICINVRDHGSGIPESDFTKIFEPFFTTKSRSQGIGIGLSLAKHIVEKDFRGTLTVDSRLGAGSTFKVYLPIREP